MPEITIDHILKACEWAKGATAEPVPLGGTERQYDQKSWDCGTSCCIWGAASILSGNGPASKGPPKEWAAKDTQHLLLAALMKSSNTTPDQIATVAMNLDLRGVDLRGVDLRGVDLRGVDLRNVNLRGAILHAADLRGVDLRGANLYDADLSSADLSGADLSGANLRGANLYDADLSGAILYDADLSGANLRGADLSGVVILLGNRHCVIQ